MTSEQLAWKIRRHGIEMTHLSGDLSGRIIFRIKRKIGKIYKKFSFDFHKYSPFRRIFAA